jgi:probable phosphoglycerate mutase
MSDLQCPATLLIASHGDTEQAVGSFRSDDGGALTDNGREQVRRLVEQVRPRRIAGVYSSTMDLAVDSAELAASALGVSTKVADGLEELCPGGEDDRAVVKRFTEALDQIADTHRGETVLVFTHVGVMSMVIPRVAVNVRNDLAAQQFLPNCVPAEVDIDADGWRIVSWPVSTDQAIL